MDDRYVDAFVDWMACAASGRSHATFVEMPDALLGGLHFEVMALGVSGHLLDYDDTYTPGLSHLSAPTAPVAVLLAARLDRSVGEMLGAYAAGFEVMARFSARSHPALYDAGWHPTAVCGTVGAAATAAELLGLDGEATRHAVRIALLSAAGLRSAFGSHGKAIQVGRAAADGLLAAQLAEAGASVGVGVERGAGSFSDVYGGDVASALDGTDVPPAVSMNWLKAYPSCLQTHACIDAGRSIDLEHGRLENGEGTVVVHPVSRQAAGFDDVSSGLEAKFSIPYMTAWGLLRGRPVVRSFDGVDDRVLALARRIRVRVDESLGANACVLHWRTADDEATIRIDSPRGSPSNPMSKAEREQKVLDLAGPGPFAALGELEAPAQKVVDVLAT